MNLKNKTFFIKSLGCRVNLFESNGVLKQLSDLGAIYVDNESNAEIIVINTCSVTNKADSKSRYEINKACNSEKCELVVVIGCYSQLNAKEIVNDKVKIIIGTAYKSEVGSLIKELKPKQTIKKIINVRKENKFEADKEADYRLNTRAFVKIQDGCNFMCSYCLIPYARGVQRSMPDGELIETIKNLVANNFKEIILTGVNTAGYKYKNVTFYDILKKIDKLDGDFRIRISSLEPFQINAKIIKLLTSNKERWCQSFHLCLQSADNTVLKAMNRRYTFEKFFSLVKLIRKYSKNASITTDYIVGFPTETLKQFENSVKNLKTIKFSDMHIFPYSPRKDTAAEKLDDIVGSTERTKRFKIIDKLNITCRRKYLKSFVGEDVDVLFEKPKSSGLQVGHSNFFFKVQVNTNEDLTNRLFRIRIIDIKDDELVGNHFLMHEKNI